MKSILSGSSISSFASPVDGLYLMLMRSGGATDPSLAIEYLGCQVRETSTVNPTPSERARSVVIVGPLAFGVVRIRYDDGGGGRCSGGRGRRAGGRGAPRRAVRSVRLRGGDRGAERHGGEVAAGRVPVRAGAPRAEGRP